VKAQPSKHCRQASTLPTVLDHVAAWDDPGTRQDLHRPRAADPDRWSDTPDLGDPGTWSGTPDLGDHGTWSGTPDLGDPGQWRDGADRPGASVSTWSRETNIYYQ